MSIVGVEKLVYGSADLAAGIKFHKDWGLDCTRENGDGPISRSPTARSWKSGRRAIRHCRPP